MVDRLITEIVSIKDRDPKSQTDHDYDRRNYITSKLFGTVSLHDAFARKHPEFCLGTVIWMESFGNVNKLKAKKDAKVYSSDGKLGATIRIHPNRNKLIRCWSDYEEHPGGAYLYFEQHSNIVWLDDRRKEIHRYDPQIGYEAEETKAIDTALKDFFSSYTPDYTYRGNTLSEKECVQGVRWKERGILDCFCQEYTLIYAYNRLAGMSHKEAALDLLNARGKMEEKIKRFYLQLI